MKKKTKKCKWCGKKRDLDAERAFCDGLAKPDHPEIKKHMNCGL